MKHYAIIGRFPDEENFTHALVAASQKDAVEQFVKLLEDQYDRDDIEQMGGPESVIIEAVLSSEAPIEIISLQ